MKLRAIHLTNVRRFAGETASITGIGDGVTTISAPNEAGKSTFFDALHAVFFIDHKSQAQEVKSLQPYARGAVQIAVDVEDDEGKAFRIEKKYLSQKSATISEAASGRIIAQEGEAEAWIDRLIGAGDGGPAGLLWVRQGVTGLEPAGGGAREKSERDRLREARQSLMSSVAGQVDSITGGRRMDAIMKACAADLDQLATRTGNPKAGGAWAQARADVERLEEEERALSGTLAELSDDLAERAELRRQDKEEAAQDRDGERRERLAGAEAAVAQARGHVEKVEQARRALRLAEIEVDRAREKKEQALAARTEAVRIEKAVSAADKTCSEAEKTLQDKDAELKKAEDALETAREEMEAARRRVAASTVRKERAEKARRAREVQGRLDKAEEQEAKRKSLSEQIEASPATQECLAEIERTAARHSQLVAQRDAVAPRLKVDYDGAGRISGEHGEIPGGVEIPVPTRATFALPGIGRLSVMPAERADSGELEVCDRDLAAAFEDLGVKDLAEARAAGSARLSWEHDKARAEDALSAYAPDGIEALRREAADLVEPEEVAEDPGAEEDEASDTSPEDALAEAEVAHRLAGTAREAAQRERGLAAEALAAARMALQLAQKAADVERVVPDEAAMADLEEDLAGARKVWEEARDALEELLKTAPDLEAAEAELERLVSVAQGVLEARETRRSRISELDGLIRARAEDGIEARLSECRGELERARARQERYAEEVAVLQELRAALETARAEARETYFEPVKQELLPLLKMLHPDAEIEMDPDTMLPARLLRDGAEEEVDVLSGGAAEQIAILTRLAFARLYARQGRAIPIVLDDALVYSDDARIVQMFTALTRVARDQQILVFSCRTRAFEDLGGTRPTIARQRA